MAEPNKKSKLLKRLIIAAIVVVLLSGVTVGLLMAPPVQRMIALKVINDQEGVEGDLKALSLGLNSISVNGVALNVQGSQITADQIDIDYSLFSILGGKKVIVKSAVATGLVVDARNTTGERKPAKEQPSADIGIFRGLYPLTQTGYRYYVDGVKLDGKVLLPNNQTLALDVSGGGIKPGETGTFTYAVTFDDATAGAPVETVQVDGTLDLTQDAKDGLSGFALNTDITAAGPDARKILLTYSSTFERLTASEQYFTELSATGGRGKQQVLVTEASYAPSTGKLTGKLNLDVSREDFGALLAGLAVPDKASVTGSAAFSLTSDLSEADISLNLDSLVGGFGNLDPTLSSLPSFATSGKFEIKKRANTVALNEATLSTREAGSGRQLLSLVTKQPFSVELPSGDKELAFDAPQGELLNLDITGLPLAYAAPFLGDIRLNAEPLEVSFRVIRDGEEMRFEPSRALQLRNLSMAQAGTPMLRGLNIFASPRIVASEDQTIQITLDDLKVFTEANTLVSAPAIALTADLTNSEKPRIVAKGSLEAFGGPILAQPFADPFRATISEAVNVFTSFDVEQSADLLAIKDLRLIAQSERGQDLFSARTLKPTKIPLGGEIKAPANGDLLRIDLNGITAAQLSPYLPMLTVRGREIRGALVVSGDNGAFVVATETPLATTNLTISPNTGTGYVEDLDLTLDLNARYDGTSATFAIKELSAKRSGSPLVSGTASGKISLGEQLTGTAEAKLDSNLARLFEQPLFRELEMDTLIRGKAGIRFKGSLGKRSDATIGLTLAGIQERGQRQALPGAQLNISTTVSETGAITAKVPLTIDGVRADSDFVIDAQYTPGNPVNRFEVTATGKQIVIDDVMTIVQAFSAAAAEEQTLREKSRVPDTAPVWKGYEGTINLSGVNLVYGEGEAVQNLTAKATLTTDRLSIDKVSSGLSNTTLAADGFLAFEPSIPQEPYTYSFDFALPDWDVGAYLKALQDTQNPPAEALLNVDGNFYGRGPNMDFLLDKWKGNFKLASDSGVLRPLSAAGDKGSATNTILGLGAGISGLLGGDVGGSAASALSNLRNLLTEMNLDKLRLEIVRGDDLNTDIRQLLFQNDKLKLEGVGGKITYDPRLPFTKQPLLIPIQISAKEDAAELFNELRLLSSERDKEGYFKAPTFKVTGSLVDTSTNLNQILARSATSMLSGGTKVNLRDSEPTTPTDSPSGSETSGGSASDQSGTPSQPSSGSGGSTQNQEESKQPSGEDVVRGLLFRGLNRALSGESSDSNESGQSSE